MFLIQGLLLLSTWTLLVHAYPVMMFDPITQKCVFISAPAYTRMVISYEMDDIEKVPPISTGNETQVDTERRQDNKADKTEEENEGKLKDIVMLIIPHQRSVDSTDNNISSNGKKKRTVLEERSGKVEYDTADSFEGDIRVCIYRLHAQNRENSHVTPSLLSLKIDLFALQSILPDSVKEMTKKRKKQKTHLVPFPDEIHDQVINRKMKSLAYAVSDLIDDMVAMNSMSDHIKNKEYDFHERSEETINSIKWWPIVHLITLFITGVCQANHMVNFFKIHHII